MESKNKMSCLLNEDDEERERGGREQQESLCFASEAKQIHLITCCSHKFYSRPASDDPSFSSSLEQFTACCSLGKRPPAQPVLVPALALEYLATIYYHPLDYHRFELSEPQSFLAKRTSASRGSCLKAHKIILNNCIQFCVEHL